MGEHSITSTVFNNMSGEFPTIKSAHSLVAKHVTKERWDKVKDIETKTCGFTIAKACACAIEFDNQHCGIYAGDWDSYKDFSEIFDAIIQDYHGISADAKHTSDMDPEKIVGNIEPEGRGIFHNDAKTFLMWVNEEDQTRIISMEKGGDVKGVFARLARGIKAVGDSVKAESGKDYALSEQYGYIHSCPTNLGTGMRASVHVDLPGYTKEGVDKLKARCEELAVQPRGTRGESGGQTGHTYDISNKHRLGYSEVQLVQVMIDGVNTLWKEDKELQKK